MRLKSKGAGSSYREVLPVNEVLIASAVFLVAYTSIVLTRVADGISLVWPANAVAGAILIRLPRVRWWSAWILLAAAIYAANFFVAQRSWHLSLLFSCLNLAEVAMMVGAFRFLRPLPYPTITISQASLMTLFMGIATPGVVAIGGGLIIHAELGRALPEGTLQWWSSHSLGACLIAPPIILFSRRAVRNLMRPEFRKGNLATLAACSLGCYGLICYARFPFVAIGVLLLAASFRLGGFGTAFNSLLAGVTITSLWALGVRPQGLEAGSSSASLAGLPVLTLLATVMPAIAIGIGVDSRRRMASALRRSEKRFREAMEHSPIGILIANLDGVWAFANRALQKMLGYSAEEFRALPPGGPSDPEDWSDSKQRWQRLLSGEIGFYEVERRFRHKDGHRIWTHVAVSLVRDDHGEPWQLIAQIESLEARRLAEQNLAAERERLRITLQSIDDAVVTTDSEMRVTYLNAAAERLLGFSLRAVERRRVNEILVLTDPTTSREAPHLIDHAVLQGEVVRRQQPVLIHRPDGTISYTYDVVSPVFDSARVLSGMVIVLRDATREVEQSSAMKHQATYDALTGLLNRSEFQQRLQSTFERTKYLDEGRAALLAIDLDRFKAVNDSGGHAAGDAMLCKVAETLRAAVRSADLVARLGGDEFAILLASCPEHRATAVAQKVLQALNPLELAWAGAPYQIGASIGLAMRTAEMTSKEDWLAAADGACYTAKRAGRAQLRIVSQAPSQNGAAVIASVS